MRFSDKQAYCYKFSERPGTYHLIVGPTQCGKSESAVAGFGAFATKRFFGHDFALVAKGGTQMEAVVAPKLRSWATGAGLEIRENAHRILVPDVNGGHNQFIKVLARDGEDQAAKRIQGTTLSGVYFDEFPKMPADLVDMADTRMSVPGAKMVGTMNPEGPEHWAKLDWIDLVEQGTLDGEVLNFALADNPALTIETIDRWKAKFTGPFYRRMILGEWAASSGLVHPVFHQRPMPDEREAARWEVALDFGLATITHAVLVGYFGTGWWIADEWVYDGRLSGQMDVKEQAAHIEAWATKAGARSIASWIIPPDAHGLFEEIGELAYGDMIWAHNEVMWGIHATNRRLENGLYVAKDECRQLRRERASYKWDEKAGRKGDDRPDKESAGGAHGCDALRYWAATAEAIETGRYVWQ